MMTSDLTGRVSAVNTVPLGDVLAEDAPVGSTVLVVEDAADFDERGGSVLLDGTDEVVYTSADDDTGTLVLAMPTTVEYLAETRVEVWDPVDAAPVVETLAQVVVEGTDQGGDPLEATVDHALIPLLPEGIRTPDPTTGVAGEAVSLQWRGDDLYVVNVHAKNPVFDGSMIDPDTLPDLGGGSDGVPPAYSPTPEVKGTVGALLVSWEPVTNGDPVEYEVHVSTTEIVPVLDGPTKVARTAASSAIVRTLPDGTPLDYATTYFVYVFAIDPDDSAPVSVAGSGSPVQITGADVAAEYVYAGAVSAGQITSGEMNATVALVGSLATARDGRRVEISNEAGLTIFEQDGNIVVTFPTDPDHELLMNGDVVARTLTALAGMELRGTSTVETGGQVTLAGQLGGSATPPAVAVGYDTATLAPSGSGWSPIYGSFVPADAMWTPGFRIENGSRLVKTSPATHVVEGYWQIPNAGTQPACGVTRNIDSIFVLYRNSTSPTNRDYTVKKYAADWNPDLTGTVAPTLTGTYTYQAPDNSNPYYNLPWTPAIGWDLTNSGYVIACRDYYVDSTNLRFRVHRYSNSGALVQEFLTAAVAPSVAESEDAQDLRGLFYGAADLGATHLFIATSVRAHAYTTTGASAAAHSFPLNGPNAAGFGVSAGFSYGFSGFGSYASGALGTAEIVQTRYGTLSGLGAAGAKWWTAFTWFDSTEDTGDPSNVKHESSLSAIAGFTMKNRARVTVTAPPIPSGGGPNDPNSVRFYMASLAGSTPPARSAFAQQTPAPADGAITATYSTFVLTPGGSNPAPPASSTFPNASPGRLTSSKTDGSGPIVDLKGDGSGRLGEITWDADGHVFGAVPAGALMPYAGSTAPAGWLMAQGQQVSRPIANGGTTDTYKALWAAIGTTYGAGNGSTTFNVPNMQDYFPLGSSAARPRGTSGGSRKITTANLPPHTHDKGTLKADSPGSDHQHDINRRENVGTNVGVARGNAANTTDAVTNAGTGQHEHTISGSTGNGPGTSTDYLPPFVSLNFIIRY